jgi:hypothetical protein
MIRKMVAWISLALAVLILLPGLVSYWAYPWIGQFEPPNGRGFYMAMYGLNDGVSWAEVHSLVNPRPLVSRVPIRRSLLGFDYYRVYECNEFTFSTSDGRERTSGYTRIRTWRLPLWLPCIVFLAYPAVAFLRGSVRRRVRRRRRSCAKCGYDLTGNVSGRCPECGAKT